MTDRQVAAVCFCAMYISSEIVNYEEVLKLSISGCILFEAFTLAYCSLVTHFILKFMEKK